MSLVVVCRKCGRKIFAKEDLAGRQFRCPECNVVNQLPNDAAAPPNADPATGVCPVCGFDLWIDPDQVRDNRGRRFHRACFGEVRANRRPGLADSEVVRLYQPPRIEEPKPPVPP